MILIGNYTGATLNPGVIASRLTRSPAWPTASKIVKGSAGYLFVDTGSGVIVGSHGVMSGPTVPLDWNLLIDFTWHQDGDGVFVESHGSFAPYLSNNTSDIVVESHGVYVEPVIQDSNTSNVTVGSYGDAWIDVSKINWIAWSDVGSLDFSIRKKNVAGAMSMDWDGYVYGIKKLNGNCIVYGAGGVSIVTPTGAMMGLNTIHRIGLIGRDAFAGTNSVHYFIDKLGCLYQLSDSLKKLDYREYLSGVSSPTLLFDETTNFLHICNGTYGYVYSQETNSFGAGPINISGYGYKDGTRYLTAPAAIATPVFEICTDIYDFGTRNRKTIHTLECGTDLSSAVLQGAIDYRDNYGGAFTSTAWVAADQEGQIRITCRGNEFKFRLKTTEYKAIELDYFNVNYIVHVH